LLFDPQTSGGLLLSVAGEEAQRLGAELMASGVPAAEIGEVLPQGKPLIRVI
jgi:selenide,water dikinase